MALTLRYDEGNDDITTDQKFEACRKQLRLMGLVASIDPERQGPSGVASWPDLQSKCSCSLFEVMVSRTLLWPPAGLAFVW